MASVPPQRSTANDDSRLPWLDASPAGVGDAAIKPGAGSAGARTRWLVSIVIVALIGVAAFLLGRKGEVTLIPTPAQPLATTPLAPADPARPEVAPAPAQETAPALARADAESARGTRESRAVLHLRPEQVRAVRRIASAARVQVHHNTVPKVVRQAYSPRVGPPGRVVQLGAYNSVADAEAAAQKFRYKYRGLLAAVPKAVMPFRPKNSRRMFYRVQFIVPSQAYAEVTCQRLRAAAKSCIVVY